MSRKKISIIGAGNVGSIAAYIAANKQLADLVLIDLKDGVARGKALDLLEATPLLKSDVNVTGTSDYKATKDSDIVIVTAGVPRTPGISRDDLIEINSKIIKSIIKPVVNYSPNCFLIIITNPLDAMVYLAKKLSKFPKNRIMGMAGVLDSTRFRTFISAELKVSVEDVNAFVLGGHGDTMVPLPHYSTVSGIPITELLPKSTIDKLVERTRKGGGEIVNLLKSGSAFYAPGASAIEMAESILLDKKRILPCAVELNGEYGEKGIFIGVPVMLGKDGVEKIIEVKLNDKENKAFKKTVEHVKELTKHVDKIISQI